MNILLNTPNMALIYHVHIVAKSSPCILNTQFKKQKRNKKLNLNLCLILKVNSRVFEQCVLLCVFQLLGLALFILGMIVRFSPNTIVDGYLQPLFEQGNTNANQDQFGVQVQDQFNNLDLSAILSGIGIAIIVVGVIILVIGFLGLFGALCQSRCMLIAVSHIICTP